MKRKTENENGTVVQVKPEKKKKKVQKDSRKSEQLEVREIPVPLNSNHPNVPHGILPKHEFSIGIIAPKGAGKTTLLCNFINYYKGYFNTIIVFSPTVKNDEKWDWVKQQKLLVENVPLIRFLKQLKDKERNQNKVVGDPPKADALMGLVDQANGNSSKRDHDDKFDARIPEGCFYHDYDEETLKNLLHQQQQMVDLLKLHGKTKHLANRILFLFDDLVGSSLFSGARQNTFKMLNTNHRHLSVSLCMISQSFKEIPKTIRNQFSCLILFEIYNDSEIESIYEEFPMGMKKQIWYEAYRYCVDDEYGFMYYNIQKPKNLRVMKNFKQVLFVK